MSFATFQDLGWLRFAPEPAVLNWLLQVRQGALACLEDPAFLDWWRCGGTWFVGVNALDNDSLGRVGTSEPLSGEAIEFIRRDLDLGEFELDRAQVSAILPGYPRIGHDENAASYRFRHQRDAAHVDGLHAIGPERRRMQKEFQGFLLGLPLTHADNHASPLVVWQGSHQIIGAMYRQAFQAVPPDQWHLVDLTAAYQAARRKVFARCERVVLHAEPGAACLLHRFTLHGIAPWYEGAEADPVGRVILYFRPGISRRRWLSV